ncbi:SPOR domain-containing protein [Oceanobacillus bengalensis]|uniref:SPOR domain-containing protein n=2 Tax=Oceanobacillus bengalensis TaxID=1435466 RepID=A0A494Z6L8_9BACI|nr:SPOR domain-containing protein [Oceanobacillus bengalensis]
MLYARVLLTTLAVGGRIMDKRKSIIVKQNGKVTKIIEHKAKNIHTSNQEAAATLKESGDDQIPAYERKTDLKKVKPFKKSSKFSTFKPIAIAITSAIIIGLVLSVIMFQVFVNVEDGSAGQALTSVPVSNADEEVAVNDTDKPIGTSVYSIDSIQAFVLQAGVFSEMANAEEWATQFQQAGAPTLIWEKDNQYFLLVGVSETKEQAEKIATELSTADHDIFVKEWSTNSYEIELTEEENEWLQHFRESWLSAVQLVSENNTLTQAHFETNLEGSEKLSTLLEETKAIEEVSGREAQQVLLHLLMEYEKLLDK